MITPVEATLTKVRSQELACLPVFTGLPTNQLKRLARLFGRARFAAGDRVFAAGDAASQLYVLEAGEVVIRFEPDDGGCLDIASLYPGSAFGWSAAMKRAYYTASAICRTDVQALAIQATDLFRLMSENAALHEVLLERIAEIAASRLNNLGRQVIRSLAAAQLSQTSRHTPDRLLIPRL